LTGSSIAAGSTPEIFSLVSVLHDCVARLVALTGGQVDAVVHRSGQRHLLPVAQADIQRSATTFQNIFRHAAVGIVSADAQRRVVECNPAFCAMLGFDEAELLGSDFATLADAEHVPGSLALLDELQRGERHEFVVEKRFLHRTGASIWSRISVSALASPAGELAGFVAIVEDISDRKVAEADNRRLGERLAATVASITDAFFTLDAEFRFTHVNDRAARLLGSGREALLGHTVSGHAGFAADDPFGVLLHEAATFRESVQGEGRLEAAGRWLDMRVYPAAAGLTVVLHDITERRQHEERLRLLEVSLGQLNDFVIITEACPDDAAGPRIVFVNDAFVRRTGYTRAEAYGQTPRLMHGPKTQRAELDRIHAAALASKPVRAELINYTKDGEEFWIETDIVPVTGAADVVTHFVAVERETTSRRREQAVLEQQAALLDLVQDSIIVRGMDGQIRYWNRSAERIYGWTSAEAVGQHVHDLLYDSAAEGQQLAMKVLAEGRWDGQVPVRHKDGRHFTVQSSLTLMRDEDGAPRAILGVNTDITQRLAMEERLRQSQRLEAVGQLTGGIAHDFNNLLTIILGNAEMMTLNLGEYDELLPIATMILGAAERGAVLTSQLLAFSRQQTLAPKVVDVNALLVGLSQMLRRTLGENVAIDIAPAAGIWNTLIDPLQLESAVLNLCINARDAMPSGGRLTIETANVHLEAGYAQKEPDVTPGRYVMIAVSDTGIGMPSDVAARAFEPYFTTKDVGRGSGLGLSMVFGFIKQSGGHVKIYSEPGHGTVVRMYIPDRRSAADAVDPTAQPRLEEVRGGDERLLLVEDDAMVRQHVANQIRRLGYRLVEVADARAALEVLQDGGDIDLLFTDVMMPGGMNGVQLSAAARQLRPGLRVLFSSGYSEGAGGLQGLLEPGSLLLSKPYRLRDLAEKIRLVLDDGG
jgi:PAS domain S-box-containing protein